MSDTSHLVHEPWPSYRRQREGVAFGTWTFLASEVLFFGALLLTYAIYRTLDPTAFAEAASHTNIVYGSINTTLLLTSSLVMTGAIEASRAGSRRLTLSCVVVTVAIGVAFLVVKGFEYDDDIRKHLLPGPDLPVHAPTAQIFFALYWVMTGVHAIHLFVGVAILAFIAMRLWRRSILPQSTLILASGLYWHFVDTVWVILYALIYLPGRA